MSEPSSTVSTKERPITSSPTPQSLAQWLDQARQSNITIRLSTAIKPVSLQECMREKELDALAAMRQFDRDMNQQC
ncbi:uncharacterized protein PgNI_00184 [Pyricularia grisea]|uniref:Uncharacterized protein n=1 Tax=Pyricularia grisea TaxID=148305 RepID=A0A6P8BL20_PYRGI|nr:uncharacterized protein PgNI_00184 [Pyricularia grisea]TLD17297.1 hypothetical protein PgNI_00184 [Pyricularia grisea]